MARSTEERRTYQYERAYERRLRELGWSWESYRGRPYNEAVWREVKVAEDKRLDRAEYEIIQRLFANSLARYVRSILALPGQRQQLKQDRETALEASLTGPERRAVEDEFAEAARQLPSPWDLVRQYNEARANLIATQLRQRGLELCRECRLARPDVELVLLDGQGVRGVTDCMSRREWFDRYRTLTQLCLVCIESREEPNRAVVIDYGTRGETFCHVRSVRNIEGQLEMQLNDIWTAVPAEVTPLSPLSQELHLLERIPVRVEAELEVPPALEYGSSAGLVIPSPDVLGYDLPIVDLPNV